MTKPNSQVPAPTSGKHRLGPMGLFLAIALALMALWFIVEIGLSLVGVATSPLGWIISLIGTLVGLIAGKTG